MFWILSKKLKLALLIVTKEKFWILCLVIIDFFLLIFFNFFNLFTFLSLADLQVLGKSEVVYETFPGWEQDISKIKKFEDLPVNCQKYVQRIGELVGVKSNILFISIIYLFLRNK